MKTLFIAALLGVSSLAFANANCGNSSTAPKSCESCCAQSSQKCDKKASCEKAKTCDKAKKAEEKK